MTDTSTYQSTLWWPSVSESDTDPLNSTVNSMGNPSLVKSSPNISVSRFIDESPYNSAGTRLDLQWEGIETRITRVVESFQN